MTEQPDFTLGIEEEYLLVDARTGELAELPDALMARCKAELHGQVSPEFLRCQIEIGTPVCADIAQARDHLVRLRGAIARIAAEFGLAPISASCHPFADWRDQHHTDTDRYHAQARDMASVARRMLICGMHVHVGLPDPAMRIDIMNQLGYFLPHLLAVSASSPFWLGEDTGLDSYRSIVFGNMPRTGLPPRFDNWADYERSVKGLTDLGIIEDSSKIWWDMRPSHRFPTLETRICDASPRLSQTLTLAALIQATIRMLWRLSRRNQRWREYDNFLLAENRWRAIRYGSAQGLIDFGARSITPLADLAEDWLALISEDADALGSQAAIARLRDMIDQGNSAAQQRAILASALTAGATRAEAMQAVIQHLIAEFTADLTVPASCPNPTGGSN